MQFEPIQPPVRTTPLGKPRQWQAVIAAAASVCQCTGACGNQHTRTGRRCNATHDTYRKGQGWVHLIAAPADLTLSDRTAAAVPTFELRAWCPKCYRGARRIQRAAAADRHHGAPADTLFGVDALE